MNAHHPLVESVLLPLALGLGATGLSRFIFGPERAALAAGLGISASVIGALIWMAGWPTHPAGTLEWLTWMLAGACVAGLAVGRFVGRVVRLDAGVPAAGQAAAVLVAASLGLAGVALAAGSLALFQRALLLASATAGVALWQWPVRRAAIGPAATLVGAGCWVAIALALIRLTDAAPVSIGLLCVGILAGTVTTRWRAGPIRGPLIAATVTLLFAIAALGWQQWAPDDSGSPGRPADDPYLN